jgi:hypothetical protein
MDDNAYNRNIANMVKAINARYVSDAESKRQLIKDMPITGNTLGGRRMRMHKGGEMMGSGFWDDFGSGFVKGFTAPFQVVNKLVGGKKGRKMAGAISTGGISTGGISTGGGFLDDIVSGIGSAVKLAPLLGLGKSKGRPRKMAGAISTGGISTGGRRHKMTKEGAGFFDDVLGIASKVAPLALALGKPKRGRRKMGGTALDNRDADFETPIAIGDIPVGGRRHKMAGAISTGGRRKMAGISTGGLSRKLLGARAVGSGYSELEGAGFFDDVLDGIGNVSKLVDKGLDIGDKLGLFKGKGKKGKKGGISTGGRMTCTGGKRGASNWIAHVKAYAKKHNVPYNQALKQARATYKA